MLDLKELIKWLILCFKISLNSNMRRKSVDLTLFFLFLYFNVCAGSPALISSDSALEGVNKNSIISENVVRNNLDVNLTYDQSNGIPQASTLSFQQKNVDDSTGRTFGRPFKKMIAGLIPVIFQIGAASTWAVIAALVGFKTLLVTLAIFKMLLLAGAVKFGALFAGKFNHHHHQEPSHGWSPQKEIHLHIHNGQHQGQGYHEETYGPWNRDGALPASENKPIIVQEPVGPQIISTPYGNYMRVDQTRNYTRRRKRDYVIK